MRTLPQSSPVSPPLDCTISVRQCNLQNEASFMDWSWVHQKIVTLPLVDTD